MDFLFALRLADREGEQSFNLRLRPYHVESIGSRQITEVKQRRAWLVLGWVTTTSTCKGSNPLQAGIISDTQLMKNKGRGVSGFHILRSLLQIIQNGFKLTAQ